MTTQKEALEAVDKMAALIGWAPISETDQYYEIARCFIEQSASEWQPIETAPKDGTTVIVGAENDLYGFVMGYGSYESHAGIAGWICKGFTDPPGELGLGHPTLWRPLPNPPKTDDSGD